MIKIGLLGGSFDPPHKGHLYISLEAKKILKLDEIWWLVTPQNPHKIYKPATYYARINNCKILTKTFPIKVKEIEKKINSKYSFQTIRYLSSYYKNYNFYWLMGSDNLINFHKWEKWQEIFKHIPVVVFKRHGYNTKALKSIALKRFTNFNISNKFLFLNKFNNLPAWTWIDNKEIKISSSEIRKQREKWRKKY